MEKITTLGIDLAKNVFSLHGVNANGKVALKLGRLDERHMRIEDEYGRLKRKNV